MPNEDQIAYWNGPRGVTWVAEQELRDRSLAPFGAAALALGRVQVGESAIDVGCGCGATALALADAVGPSGAVLGVDVSAPMLARACERAGARPWLRFEQGDAATRAFDGSASLLFSRFGVMFFDDPTPAFTNLRTALAPDGRLAFVCWRALHENLWMSVPFEAVERSLPALRGKNVTGGPGPLALADPALVRRTLELAGFRAIEIEPYDHPMPLGDGRGLEAAAAEAVTIGPAARLLANADEATLAQARKAVRSALAPHVKDDDVRLPGAAWLVTGSA